MKAIVQDRYGSADVLSLREVDRPTAGAGEVLVRVHAAAVNARDWHLMRGDPYLARLIAPELGLANPKIRIRGTDFAGVVAGIGPDVTRLRVGDEVYGEAGNAFAEYVRAPESAVDHKPGNLTFEQAAAVPLAANTALIALRDLAGVHEAQHVLVNGASGGVGTFAVQLAKVYGATVTAVCSTRNVELVRSLGADQVVDYTREDFTRSRGVFDVIFDLVGNRSLADCRRALAPTGVLLLAGGGVSTGGSLVGPMKLTIRGLVVGRFARRQKLAAVIARPSRENLTTLRELIEAGRLAPVIDRTYPRLDEAPEAIRYLEIEHARAKVVITV
jgi:NADPH:quinone reductase-like Zn-dependent oxidoreductase